MRTWILAFLLGDSLLLTLSSLPNLVWVWLLLIICATFYFFRALHAAPLHKLLFACLLGFAWGLLHAHAELNLQLPTDLESKTLLIKGTVASIPEQHDKNVSFDFFANFEKPMRIRLNWFKGVYSNSPLPLVGEGARRAGEGLHVGDTWQLTVRLKRPRSFWNQGSFDYEGWLFERHVHANGYVVESENNKLIKTNHFSHAIDRLREYLANTVTQSLKDKPLVGLINALTVGVRNQITEQQWQVMRGTGTNHLFAIAGLHIGFVAGMIYALVSFIWRRAGRLSLYIPTPQAAAFASLIAAIFYSALAGFALPTQRAVIMLSVFLLATLLRKQLPAWTAWSLAIFIVLLIEPLAVLSDSFWLSFGAVAYIIYGISARVGVGKWWQHWARTQWVVAVGLIPLTLLFFHQSSLAGFFANAFAIPWVGFVVLPLCLLGSLTGLSFLISLSERAMELIWPALEYISHLDQAQWFAYIANSWVLVTASIAMILLLAPRGFPARWLGIIWLLPLIIWKPAQPKYGEVWFTLLDVGQGLASVVRTQHHVLIYDAGPKFSESFDTGNAVVVPYLNYVGVNTVDTLMISHPDNDHIGGANSVLSQLKVKQIFTSAPEKFKSAQYCEAGQHWQWDGVRFDVLYPTKTLQGLDNDSSCVLRVDNGKQSIFLVGDIEKASEKYLVANAKEFLTTTILVVPHHGSKTSSTIDFVNAVHPQYALFPVGYRNKFGFPKAEVVRRYQQINAKIFTTVDDGSIMFKLIGDKILLETYREKFGKFWN